MRTRINRGRPRYLRRGSTVVLVGISLVFILGFVALAVDLGRLFVVRTELQRAADSAALAGVSALVTDAGLMQQEDELYWMAADRAGEFAFANPTLGNGTLLEMNDVLVGTFDFSNINMPLDMSGTQRFNAVRITLRREAGSANGPIVLMFASALGINTGNVRAAATAAFDDRFAGYSVEEAVGPSVLPFTIHEGLFGEMVLNGDDNFSYDGTVYQAGDGVPEVTLYPWRQNGSGNGRGAGNADDTYIIDGEGAGNFGLLHFGAPGAASAEENIRNGISPAEIADVFGSEQIIFHDENGDYTYPINGEPGLTASVADAIHEKVGEVVGFFVHNDVTGNGSNTDFTSKDMRFGRIMEIDLTGSPKDKRFVLQPVPMASSNVIISEDAPPSGGLVGRLVLVR